MDLYAIFFCHGGTSNLLSCVPRPSISHFQGFWYVFLDGTESTSGDLLFAHTTSRCRVWMSSHRRMPLWTRLHSIFFRMLESWFHWVHYFYLFTWFWPFSPKSVNFYLLHGVELSILLPEDFEDFSEGAIAQFADYLKIIESCGGIGCHIEIEYNSSSNFFSKLSLVTFWPKYRGVLLVT